MKKVIISKKKGFKLSPRDQDLWVGLLFGLNWDLNFQSQLSSLGIHKKAMRREVK
jgi:hypothetical protein